MKPIKPENKSHKNKEKDFKQKLNMFDRIPDHCLTCNSPFDRKNREQVQSWFVVVKNAENKVNLYCPSCWGKATSLVEQVINGEKNVTDSSDL
jgi:uncharacterized protein with PIN domain